MKCPFCDSEQVKVVETRVQKSGEVKRRRQCLQCQNRYTTVETIIYGNPQIIKKDGRREAYSQEKLKKGVELACRKRPVSVSEIEDLVERVTHWVRLKGQKEIKAHLLGQKVVEELKTLDDVAYVRFASVYKTFADVREFLQSLETQP